MIKNNKWRLIISSIIIILPCVLGFFGDKALPDGSMGSPLFFFFIPAVLLAIHWICMLIASAIDKNPSQSKKATEMIFWTIPALSLVVCGIMYAISLGYDSKIHIVILSVMALAFMITGNYMPKITRNRTLGIKIKWTLANDENWNATHRFGGKIFVLAGFLALLAIPLSPDAFPFVAIFLIVFTALLPYAYSYRFYKKQLERGTATKEEYKSSYNKVMGKKTSVLVSVIVAIVLIVVLIMMFVGDIESTLGEDALTVKAGFGYSVTLNYDDIRSIEYREDGVDGMRVMGISSAKLSWNALKFFR